jgi:hypothetical protein
VIVEVRRVVGIGAGSDVTEAPSERRGGRVLSSGRAARIPVVKPAEAG